MIEETKKPKFAVGDYVTNNYVKSRGIVYRVVKVENKGDNLYSLFHYRIKPVYGAFDATKNKGSRVETDYNLMAIDLVKLGMEFYKLSDFIKTVAEHMGTSVPDRSEDSERIEEG